MPAPHAAHVLSELPPDATVPYVLAGQPKQIVPPVEYVPATQSTHCALDEAPAGQLLPAAQVAHDVALAAVLYEPAGHWLQAVPPVEKVPAVQATHCAALVPPTGHDEPAVQLLQAVAPAVVEY